MAVTLLLERTENAQIVENADSTIIVRRGFLKGLHTQGLPPAEVFAQAVVSGGLPAYNSAYPHTLYAHCKLHRRIVDGIPGNAAKAEVTLIYESNQGLGSPLVTFVLSRRTQPLDVLTELDPATGKPITVVWRDPADNTRIIARTAQIRVNVSCELLQADGYFIGQPPAAMLSARNHVNAVTWRGKPSGYWHYYEQSDVTRDRGNSYSITLGLRSKLTEDWSTYATLKNPNGVFIPVGAIGVALLRAMPYKYGTTAINGLTKVGPYPTVDFGSVFGFGGIGQP